MTNPFDFFHEIYCIVPEHKEHVFTNTLKGLKKIGIADKINKLNATDIDRKYLNTDSPTEKERHKGTALCHLEIVKIAKEKNLENVLIFEDDVEFAYWKPDVLINAIENLKDWKLFYLGYSFEKAFKNMNIIPVSDNLIKIKSDKTTRVHSSHAYAIHNSIYDFIIDNFNPYEDFIDGWLPYNIDIHCIIPLMTFEQQDMKKIKFISSFLYFFPKYREYYEDTMTIPESRIINRLIYKKVLREKAYEKRKT